LLTDVIAKKVNMDRIPIRDLPVFGGHNSTV
jgi:hypothetical protein